MMTQSEKATALLKLHSGNTPLVLPNIWNPIGARMLQAKGFPAVATASAAVSASLGYMDGEKILRSTLTDVISRIACAVDLPVTADIEAGFAASTAELEETIEQVLDAGVVGINIEDSVAESEPLREVDEQCVRISKVREVATRRGVHLVINARVDTFLSDAYPDADARLQETKIRARQYRQAGADCIYPVGPGDAETVKALRSMIDGPINILCTAKVAPLSVLSELGVNRVSFGPLIFRSCLRKLSDIFDTLAKGEGYDCFAHEALTRDEVNALLMSGEERARE